MIIRSVFFTFVFLFAPLAISDGVAGTWKHAKNPVWIEINLEEGHATVVRSDKSPERVGRKILKEIKSSSEHQNLWYGMLYIEKLGEYKRVEISLPDSERMLITGKVGFFSRTAEWLREDTLPTP